MRTVIITAIGSSSADIVTKKCRKNGIRVIGCDMYPRGWIADAGSVEALYQVPYVTDADRYIGTMMFLCREEGAETVIPLTSVKIDMFDLHRDEFSEINVALCISGRACTGLCYDKMEPYRCLEEHMGGTVILTSRLGDVGPDEIRYPTVCKSYNGRSGQGLKMVGSRRKMEGVLGEADSTDYIAQPMIRGNMVTVDVVRSPEQGTCVAICRRELLWTPNGTRISVLIFRNRQLEGCCRAIAELLGIRGCVDMESMEDQDGVHHMLGCNPRFPSGMGFSYLAGYNCVTNYLHCFEGKEVEHDGSVAGMYITRKYEEYITEVERQGGVTGCERQSVRRRRAVNRRYNYNGQRQLCYI